MMTLYTSVGTLKFRQNKNGIFSPIVINNVQEYMLSKHELILWNSLTFQILQVHELEHIYRLQLSENGCPDEPPFSYYLNRLLLRGLIVKGTGMSGADALYRLLGPLQILPIRCPFYSRLFTCITYCRDKKFSFHEFVHYLKREKRSVIENTILKLSRSIPLTTSELITCIDHKYFPKKEQDILTSIYAQPDTTCESLTDETQFLHIQYPVLQAIGNLYLDKQILFHKL